MKMVGSASLRRLVQGMLVVGLAISLLPSPSQAEEAACEARVPSGSFSGRWGNNTLILEGEVDGNLVGECRIEGPDFRAELDACVPIRGSIEVTGGILPAPTGGYVRFTVTGRDAFTARCGEDGVSGRLTGGGWLYDYGADHSKANVGLVLPCQEDEVAQGDNMQINAGDATAHIDAVEESECLPSESDDGGGVHFGRGSGRCNGEAARAEWMIEDGGSYEYYSWWDGTWDSGNYPDHVEVEVEGAGCSLFLSGALDGGQLTMHFDR